MSLEERLEKQTKQWQERRIKQFKKTIEDKNLVKVDFDATNETYLFTYNDGQVFKCKGYIHSQCPINVQKKIKKSLF
jgi:hypothetical protein